MSSRQPGSTRGPTAFCFNFWCLLHLSRSNCPLLSASSLTLPSPRFSPIPKAIKPRHKRVIFEERGASHPDDRWWMSTLAVQMAETRGGANWYEASKGSSVRLWRLGLQVPGTKLRSRYFMSASIGTSSPTCRVSSVQSAFNPRQDTKRVMKVTRLTTGAVEM